MAKQLTQIIDPNDPNAPVASIKREVPVRPSRAKSDDLKPVATKPIKRAGLGRKKEDGRRSGGNFSLKLLTIVDDVTGAKRTLRVPLAMEYTDYPTIKDTETVTEEAEEEYTTEAVRDRVLSMQVDPFWYPNRKTATGKDWPENLGFRPFDPAWRNDEVQQGAWYDASKTEEIENRMGIKGGEKVGV